MEYVCDWSYTKEQSLLMGRLYYKHMLEVLLFFFFNKFIYLFIFSCVGSSLLRGLSLVAGSRGYSLLWCAGFSLWWLLLLWSTGSGARLSSCGAWA